MTAGRAELPSRLQRILVADDFPQAADSLARCLRQLGFTVQTANDGAEALEAAERFLPQLIFLDIEMPKLDGFEVAARVRRESWGKSTVLVAFTGLKTHRDRQHTLNAGFDYHLAKPVDFSEVALLVTDWWQQISLRKMREVTCELIGPDFGELKRAFEEARSAFNQLQKARHVEDRQRTVRAFRRNRQKLIRWNRESIRTQMMRQSAYHQFIETQKVLTQLLVLQRDALEAQRARRKLFN